MKVYAVIDTNVLVSALLAKHPDSATVAIFDRIFDKDIVPMYNEEILREYIDVLNREKFGFLAEDIALVLKTIISAGVNSERIESGEILPDKKDLVFYEVSLSREDSFLVTGNIKHFPKISKVVTPNEMLDILNSL